MRFAGWLMGFVLRPSGSAAPTDTVNAEDDRSAEMMCKRERNAVVLLESPPRQNATFLMAFMRFSFLRGLQYFSTSFLLVANLPKSTVGRSLAALK